MEISAEPGRYAVGNREGVKEGDCVILREAARRFPASLGGGPARKISREDSHKLFEKIGADINYFSEWLSKYKKFYLVELEGYYPFEKPVSLDDVIA
ncbi:hypothetical protein [Pyrobaculum aerophilum]|uniref:Uncharacterized protein n=1 Tax=Pyrobaculum aerophilum TaxID=13773 RepID=A0A371R2U6_9CREN|nr:hypothetical protein [Pyrobaculum aerophilum]RFA98065.1 hypothetical protein CGL51_01620 [Pyrobaculum aerophilum]